MNSNTQSTSDRIKYIQKYLNLEPDEIIGSATLTAIENNLFDENDKTKDNYSLMISGVGME